MAEQPGREEQIGFHKGALSTLAKEREEMAKILGIVEQLMQMHIKALKELGINLVSQAQQQGNASSQGRQAGKLDEMLKK